MSVRDRIRLWQLERRLRRLQDQYYEDETKDDARIVNYLTTLAQARELYLTRIAGAAEPHRRLHVGSGGHHIAGWINLDIDPTPPVDLLADITRPLPFRSASIDLIHSEDVLEHLDRDAGRALLSECHRLLKPGGVMRLLTPDLRLLIERVYFERNERHLAWCSAYLEAEGACEALNMHLRMNGDHRFVYDAELLKNVLERIGFAVRGVRYNWSPHPELRYLDLRDFGLNLFVEGTKG